MKKDLLITPKTKINSILETYPELEETILEVSPAFNKLKNPVLRKTVGKVATLQQAANIGNINTAEFVNILRKKIGQDNYIEDKNTDFTINYVKPDWFNEKHINKEFDTKPLLDAGEHPVNQVLSDVKKMEKDKIYKLIAPFLPIPLIEKVSGLGCRHWVVKDKSDHYLVYFIKT